MILALTAFNALSAATPSATSTSINLSSHFADGISSQPETTLGPLNNADIVMILLTISVILRVLNFHFFRIPSSVAMAFGAILMTVILLILRHIPWLGVASAIEALRGLLKDFPDLLLKYMLGFLLFAAAIEVDLRNLGRILSTVLALSVVSTLLSTFIVGTLTYFLMQNIAHMDFSWCLLFGAIVSPTDPVTVMSILNDKPDLLPSSTRYFVIGESLLNDAVGVVLYLVLMEIVQKPDIEPLEIATLLFETVFVECVYGAAIGVILAWIAYSAIVSVNEPLLEVVITFVLVGNINMVCRILNASIPLASVGAGLFIGNYAVTFAMHDQTTETFHEMWKLADETLNSILFLMIGSADLFWNPQDLGWGRVLTLVVCTISISIAARFLSVALPLLTIIFLEWLTGRRLRHISVRYRGGTIAVLTWAGMRGGISIALALGVPESFVKHAVPGHMTYGQLIFFMTFILVVFSILVQGILFEPVVKMINRVSFDIFASGGLGTYVSSTSLGTGFNNDSGEFSDVDQTPDGSFISERDNLLEDGANGQQNFYRDYIGEDAIIEENNESPVQDPSSVGFEDKTDANTTSTATPVLNTSQPSSNAHLQTTDVIYGDLPPRPIVHRTSDFQRRASNISMVRRGNEPIGHYGSMNSSGHEHARQQSITFQNLPTLVQPPSVTTFLDDLRRRGTTSFTRFFDIGRDKNNRKLSLLDDDAPAQSTPETHALRRSRTEPDNARLLARGSSSSQQSTRHQQPPASARQLSTRTTTTGARRRSFGSSSHHNNPSASTGALVMGDSSDGALSPSDESNDIP